MATKGTQGTRPGPGDKAPVFSAVTTTGERVKLADFRGRTLVLYFYPKDDTPGCTAQACSLRDHNAEITARGAAILGVSAQDEASHQRFTQKYNLNFPLIADTDNKVARAYGVLGSGLFGIARSFVGAYERVTFIIGPDGKVAHVIDHPDTRGHGDEVLRLL
ncbi:MAG: peroxiredoxin [Betaproteobacteria bacterium]|jgi:peroxiredoxin Q/BCP|nr:peroxiredoxin [Betaproteobacteria bacterium]